MKFQYVLFYKSALHEAVGNCNLDIVRQLVSRKEIDINQKYICDLYF